jgi:BirA family biotin operon repressor/biotin-[acetyl-CoA-carboxylase] ligase
MNILNFVASLSLAVSIENLYQLRTDLKWPNDILIDDKKTAGILIESTSKGSRIDRLVIGIGLNVNQIAFQRKFTIEPTSLKKELGQPVEREKTLAEILNNMEEMLNLSINFPDKILEDWKAKCKMIGKRITVFNDDVTKQGIFNDIDKDGFIILRTDDKMETLHSGDVSII